MIRVLVKGSSAIAQAGLERMIAAEPDLHVVAERKESPPHRGGPSRERPPGTEMRDDETPDVIIAEVVDPDEELLWSDAMDMSTPVSALLLLVDDPASVPQNEALRAGAKGILPRRISREELVAAIRAAATGLLVFHPDALPTPLPGRPPAMSNRAPSLVEPLTLREKEVLSILAEGGSNKDIANRLAISEHTAKFHVSSIMSKLGATSRTEAVTLAIRQGLIMI